MELKRTALLLCFFLVFTGCRSHGEMEQALSLRSRLLSAGCSFLCYITAEYEDHGEAFTLFCRSEGEFVTFEVQQPESLQGITGRLERDSGMLTFDEQILAFPLLAGGRLSPVGAPGLLVQALRSGRIIACGAEGEGLHLTVADSYADDAYVLEIRTDASGLPVAAEVAWQGRRTVSMVLEEFTFL